MIAFSMVQDNIRRLGLQVAPDRVTEAMYFYHDGKPCCIVGHVLEHLGARSTDTGHIEVANTFFSPRVVAPGLPWAKFGVRAPGKTQARWIRKVQQLQDQGHSWRVAVNAADEEFYEDE